MDTGRTWNWVWGWLGGVSQRGGLDCFAGCLKNKWTLNSFGGNIRHKFVWKLLVLLLTEKFLMGIYRESFLVSYRESFLSKGRSEQNRINFILKLSQKCPSLWAAPQDHRQQNLWWQLGRQPEVIFVYLSAEEMSEYRTILEFILRDNNSLSTKTQ